jgi:hypothetical protein
MVAGWKRSDLCGVGARSWLLLLATLQPDTTKDGNKAQQCGYYTPHRTPVLTPATTSACLRATLPEVLNSNEDNGSNIASNSRRVRCLRPFPTAVSNLDQHCEPAPKQSVGRLHRKGEIRMPTTKSGGSKRGFAAMDPAKQREIASKGGKASHGGGRKAASAR